MQAAEDIAFVQRKSGTKVGSFLRQSVDAADFKTSQRDSGTRFQTSGTPPPPGSIIMPPPQSSGCAGCTGQSGAGLAGTLALALLALLGSLLVRRRRSQR